MGAASAVCPVCTVAVGAGLESARLLGVDDVITGIWAGGLTLSVFFWTAGWLKKHNIKSILWQIIVPFISYYVLMAGVYLMPGINFGEQRMFGIDKFFAGRDCWNIRVLSGRALVCENKAEQRRACEIRIPKGYCSPFLFVGRHRSIRSNNLFVNQGIIK